MSKLFSPPSISHDRLKPEETFAQIRLAPDAAQNFAVAAGSQNAASGERNSQRRRRLTAVLSVMLGLMFLVPAFDDVAAATGPLWQDRSGAEATPEQSPPGKWSDVFSQLPYRLIGPFRGGRSCAVTGVPGKPMEFWFGATGGGVWKTTDGGVTWKNASDGFFGGSVGSIAIAPSDPNVIYVGMGEKTVRGNVSHGDGVWKSIDGGRTWSHVGLADSRHVTRLRIDPRNSDIVFAASLGHLYGPNQERGVFRSNDGGKNWQRVLFVNEEVGAVDLAMDPSNAKILYASTWRVLRTPYSLESGGEGSGLYKSTDGGETWKAIHSNSGFAQSTLGIIGVTVSPVDGNRVWALAEAKDGGLFRSDNGGETWRKISTDRNLRQRAWYYTRLQAAPDNIDQVYVMNVAFWKSSDGGKSFDNISTPHSDHHDLWIDPSNAQRMILADDGGAQVSFNGGENWSSMDSQPTAQFYRVATDNAFPYRIYGAQQDNSTVRIAHHHLDGFSIDQRQWEPTAGGESGHIAVDPTNNDIVYGGSYGGYLERVDHASGQNQIITVWPDNPIGRGAGDTTYRFQWNFPLFFSPHNPQRLYAAGNVLFKSENQGHSWTAISPDLTRNDPKKLGSSGGPITKDNTGVETYCTIFAALESPHQAGVIWAGSDDGRLHLTQDDGANWSEVTPPELPEWSQINSIEAHPTLPGGLYVAATRYKLDDFKPYLFKTTDFGATWELITNGIERDHFTRVIRADQKRAGLLYCGTERGMYVSLDDGQRWYPFQQNLPIVPITDLAIKNNDLIVATQGRAFWMIDDLSPLQQWQAEFEAKPCHVWTPSPMQRILTGGRASLTAGENKNTTPRLLFYLKEVPADEVDVKLTVSDAKGEAISVFRRKGKSADTGKSAEASEAVEATEAGAAAKPSAGDEAKSDTAKKLTEQSLELKAGINEIRWNLRYESAESFDGIVLWSGGTQGPTAIPGTYPVTLQIGDQVYTTSFEIQPDPRATATPEDYQSQLDFLLTVRDKLSECHRSIKKIRSARSQINALNDRLKKFGGQDELVKQANDLLSKLRVIEEALYQTQNESPQDPLNYPIRLNNRLSALVGVTASGNNRPTEQAETFRKEVTELIDQQLADLEKLVTTDLNAFNQAVLDAKVPAIVLD